MTEHTEGMHRYFIHAANIKCRDLGGVLPQLPFGWRGARGAEPPRMDAHLSAAGSARGGAASHMRSNRLSSGKHEQYLMLQSPAVIGEYPSLRKEHNAKHAEHRNLRPDLPGAHRLVDSGNCA